jgi:hypothetical protein
MTRKPQADDEEAWRTAKKICRLNAKQVEMARALGMNAKKLPGLRPSSHERWKLPVAEFIEERYRKRFGGPTLKHNRRVREPASHNPSAAHRDANAPERVGNAASQAEDLVCYLMTLADDLQTWIAANAVAEVLPQVSEELRKLAEALNTGAPISPIPTIPLPPRQARPAFSRRGDRDRTFDDDIPF